MYTHSKSPRATRLPISAAAPALRKRRRRHARGNLSPRLARGAGPRGLLALGPRPLPSSWEAAGRRPRGGGCTSRTPARQKASASWSRVRFVRSLAVGRRVSACRCPARQRVFSSDDQRVAVLLLLLSEDPKETQRKVARPGLGERQPSTAAGAAAAASFDLSRAPHRAGRQSQRGAGRTIRGCCCCCRRLRPTRLV